MVVNHRSSISNGMNDFDGEPGGIRTRDHRIKSAMLYQLSYRPMFFYTIEKPELTAFSLCHARSLPPLF